ncbi:SigE family RNA polymerase sigma factor [Dactylosporangium sp. NPDC000555]|uniref:SigE family RNA polymerase sigma factor n=1 Tax=Dactylosporangium sp. NPDC000555 TaxID=3154260 RepID=UPI003326900C
MSDDEVRQFQEYAAARLVPLRRLAYMMCGNWHLAEDITSTVLTKLFETWRKSRLVENLDAYVRRMLVRAVIDETRRPWRRERPAQYPLDTVGHAPDEGVVDRMVLREALARMPARRRAVLVLRFVEELSVEETAAAMGCSTGTVKSQTARGLATMRELLSAEHATRGRSPG